MSGKVQPNDLQGVFTYSNQQNYTHFTLFSPVASFLAWISSDYLESLLLPQ